MKGVVFTEFLQLVEDEFGYEVVDSILNTASDEGAYTAVGTYDYQELIQMVVALSEKVDVAVPVLVKTFGRYLYGKLTAGYADKVAGFQSSFELMENIEDHIHVEVLKLYPNAELPSFSYERPNEDTLVMNYQSSRPFADLCEGLIEACITHFEEDVDIQRENTAADGTSAKFTLVKSSVAV